MSRSVVVVAGAALACAIVAVILPFVLPGASGVSRADFDSLQGKIDNLSRQSAIRVAYVNAEDAFNVFTNAVASYRQRASDKAQEIVDLQNEFLQGTISKDDYERQLMRLRAELLDAQFAVDVNMIDKMLAANGFADIRTDLTALKEEAAPVIDEMKSLLSTAQTGVVVSTEFDSRYSQLQSAYTQLDQLLVSAASSKIVAAARDISIEKGYDLVLNTKNVIVYRNAAVVMDITDLVKAKLATYL
jgi:Skp family chaperone for outer membrane proteins